MATLKELLAQQAELDKEIAEMRQHEHADAIARARAVIDQYGLTSEDIFDSKRISKKAPSKVAVKYHDPATGANWSGRGRQPRWLEGKDRTLYLVASIK